MADVYKEGAKLTHPDGRIAYFYNGTWHVTEPEKGGFAGEQKAVGEDIAKTALPSLGRGLLSVGTTPFSMLEMAGSGIQKGGEFLGLDPAAAVQNIMPKGRDNGGEADETQVKKPGLPFNWPSYKGLMDDLQAKNGQWYEAETPEGKQVQNVIETLPAAIASPMRGGVRAASSALAKNVTRGTLGALGGESAGQLFEGTDVEPWARAAGTVAGANALAVPRAIRTPGAADPARVAQSRDLEAKGFTLTPAQFTGRGNLAKREANLSDAPGVPDWVRNLPQTQGHQFNRYALGQTRFAGDTSPMPDIVTNAELDTRGLMLNNARAQQLEPHTVAALPAWQNEASTIYGNFATQHPAAAAGDNPVKTWMERIRYGPSGTPPSRRFISGPEYQQYRSDLGNEGRKLIDEADHTKNATGHALLDLRGALDRSVAPSSVQNVPVGPHGAPVGFNSWPDYLSSVQPHREQLQHLWEGYRDRLENVHALKDAGVGPKGMLDPSQVYAHAPTGSELQTTARHAANVFNPANVTPDTGSAAGLIGSALATAGTKAAGAGAGMPDPAIWGFLAGPAAKKMLYDPLMSRAYYSPWGQQHWKNQAWLPGPMTQNDPALMSRLLMMTPPSPNSRNAVPEEFQQ